MMEISFNLPVGLLVEQVEVKFNKDENKQEMFSKYLRLLGITKRSVIRKDELSREAKMGNDIDLTVNELTEE